MASSIQDSLGNGHLVAGKLTCSAGTDVAFTGNDDSVTVARTVATLAGGYTVTFGEPFLAAPVVTLALVDATVSTLSNPVVALNTVATNSFTFSINDEVRSATGTAVAVAPLDSGDVHFMAFGKRYN